MKNRDCYALIQFVNKAFDGSETNQPSPETGLGLEELAVRLGIDLGHDTQSEELSAENGTKSASDLEKNGTKSENDTKLALSWDQVGTRLGLSWDQAGTRLGLGLDKNGTRLAPSWHQAGTKLALSWIQLEQLLNLCENAQTIQGMMDFLDWQNRTKFRNKYIKPLLELEVITMTLPNKPSSPNQEYYLTQIGKDLLKSKLD